MSFGIGLVGGMILGVIWGLDAAAGLGGNLSAGGGIFQIRLDLFWTAYHTAHVNRSMPTDALPFYLGEFRVLGYPRRYLLDSPFGLGVDPARGVWVSQ